MVAAYRYSASSRLAALHSATGMRDTVLRAGRVTETPGNERILVNLLRNPSHHQASKAMGVPEQLPKLPHNVILEFREWPQCLAPAFLRICTTSEWPTLEPISVQFCHPVPGAFKSGSALSKTQTASAIPIVSLIVARILVVEQHASCSRSWPTFGALKIPSAMPGTLRTENPSPVISPHPSRGSSRISVLWNSSAARK